MFLTRWLCKMQAELTWLFQETEVAAHLRARHLQYLNRLTPLLSAVGIANAALLVWVMRDRTAPWFGATFLLLAVLWAFVAMRGWYRRRFRVTDAAPVLAVRRVTQGAAAIGALWAIGSWVWFPAGDSGQQFLVGMVVLGGMQVGVLALATVPPAAWTYLAVVTVGGVGSVVVADIVFGSLIAVLLVMYASAQAWMALVTARIFSAQVRSEDKARERQEHLEAAHHQLINSEKMAALGALVAGVSHEVNTPLGVSITAASAVRDGLQGMRESYLSQSLTKEAFEQALDHAMDGLDMLDTNLSRASRLVKDFKQTAVHQTSERLCDFDVMETLRALLASLHPVTRRVPVRPMLGGPRKLAARGYPGALMQVVTNLIMNSVNHAFRDVTAPAITIEVREGALEWELLYSDNGVGVPLDLQSRIFEPFFTTRRGRGGTGLGLNIVYTVVTQRMGGQLQFWSQPGKGVRLQLRLPRRLASERPDSQPQITSEL